jgi:hypothetical protein
LAVKTKAQYQPDDIPKPEAARAVGRATRCVAVAKRVVDQQSA